VHHPHLEAVVQGQRHEGKAFADPQHGQSRGIDVRARAEVVERATEVLRFLGYQVPVLAWPRDGPLGTALVGALVDRTEDGPAGAQDVVERRRPLVFPGLEERRLAARGEDDGLERRLVLREGKMRPALLVRVGRVEETFSRRQSRASPPARQWRSGATVIGIEAR
jgi:hypothetical protein